MDQEILVEDIKKVIKKLEQQEGPVTLAMLLTYDYQPSDSWNFMVSSRRLNNKGRREAVEEVTKLLREFVSKNFWNTITQTTVLKTDDPFVKAINQAFRTTGKPIDILHTTIGGVFLPRAILLVSKKP
jgi:hypothetical protein